MKEIVIDGLKIKNKEQLYNYLGEELEFPTYFGKNLDALSDLLYDRVDYISFKLLRSQELERGLGSSYRPFIELLQELSENLSNIFLEVQ